MSTNLRVCAKIDLEAIKSNLHSVYDNMINQVPLMAVIKADGYGHGALHIAEMFEKDDIVFGYATATAEEALFLRDNGIKKPILILGYTFNDSYVELIKKDVEFTLFRKDTIDELKSAAVMAGKKAKVHIKVDTGMHRIGVQTNEKGLDVVKYATQCDMIEIRGIFTHLAYADEISKDKAYEQVNRFISFTGEVEDKLDISIPYKHCFNSAACMEMECDFMNLARLGISMYGIEPSDECVANSIELKPALSLYSHIVYVKEVEQGEAISYGGTYVTDRRMLVATVPVGYGDGYPRALSNKGYVLIKGRKAPILGRVCMDQFMVDVTDIEGVKEGDLVTLIGTDGDMEICVEGLCDIYDGFRYELVCDIGKRVPREYN